MLDLKELFEEHADEYLEFNREVNPPSFCPDVCVLNLFNQLAPHYTIGRSIIGVAAYNEIWFDIDPEKVAKSATEDQIISLIRCGVRYDELQGSFTMFI